MINRPHHSGDRFLGSRAAFVPEASGAKPQISTQIQAAIVLSSCRSPFLGSSGATVPIDQPDAEAQRLAVQSRSSPIANPDHTAIGSCVPLGTIALPTHNLTKET